MKKTLGIIMSILAAVVMIPNVFAATGSNLLGTVDASAYIGVTGTASVEHNGKEVIDVKFNSVELKWAEQDNAIGRWQSGWWVGLKITAPEGLDASAAKYSYDGVNFNKKWTDGRDGSSNVMSAWIPVNKTEIDGQDNPYFVAKYVFDWNGDGNADQTINIYVNPESTTFEEVDNGDYVKVTVDGVEDFTPKKGQTFFGSTDEKNNYETRFTKALEKAVDPSKNFKGYSLSTDTSKLYTAAELLKVTFNANAIIKPVYVVNVTFNGEVYEVEEEKGYESNADLLAAMKSYFAEGKEKGLKFVKWMDDEGNKYEQGTKITEDITLVAQYKVTITVHADKDYTFTGFFTGNDGKAALGEATGTVNGEEMTLADFMATVPEDYYEVYFVLTSDDETEVSADDETSENIEITRHAMVKVTVDGNEYVVKYGSSVDDLRDDNAELTGKQLFEGPTTVEGVADVEVTGATTFTKNTELHTKNYVAPEEPGPGTDPEEPTEVDKTELQKWIDTAGDVYYKNESDHSQFTDETWNELDHALQHAEEVNFSEYATQAEVDEATAKLIAAYNNLAYVEGEGSELPENPETLDAVATSVAMMLGSLVAMIALAFSSKKLFN